MAISYEILQSLRPNHFVDTKLIEVKVPVHIAEMNKNTGVRSIFRIILSEIPTKEEVLMKIEEFIRHTTSLIPSLKPKDFSFRFIGGFCDKSYV